MIGKYFVVIVLCLVSVTFGQTTATYSVDIVVYGATSAGVTAAVQASRMGKSVVLVDPDNHIGGATTGGLGWTDYGKTKVVGGLAAEFYRRVTDHYRSDEAWIKDDPHRARLLKAKSRFIKSFEPHVASMVFKAMLDEANVQILRDERLDRKRPLEKLDGSINAIYLESGKVVSGQVFIDTSYEGDLMAMAGVSYHVGREPYSAYHETAAGVLPDTTAPLKIQPGKKLRKMTQPKRYFNKVDGYIPGAKKLGWSYVNPFDADGNLLYGIQDVKLEAPGSGDAKVQAYNVRVCLTSNPDNMIPITQPENYDPAKYELLARYIQAHQLNQIKQVLYKIDPVPNLKTDINDGCPYSTDFIGANWDYPEAGYARRQEILKDHHDFTRGLLYFIGHDPRVPRSIRTEMLRYGYPKDEYQSNGHWTPQVYIRETRRMMGEYVMTQSDIVERTTKTHSVGLGSYALDSHHVQRLVTSDGNVINEGNFTIHLDGPYEIPYESLVPKKKECANLLVPVCLSTSHVAYGSVRMEPVFMLLGHAAATAAVIAIDDQVAVQNVDYKKLKDDLLKDNMVLSAN